MIPRHDIAPLRITCPEIADELTGFCYDDITVPF